MTDMHLVDFHSHILPFMDDGAKNDSIGESMLVMLLGQGIHTVYATPHFIPSMESIDSFLLRRDRAYTKLQTTKAPLPEIKLGAEIRVDYGISELDLSALALRDTRALLLELPVGSFSHALSKEIFQICNKDFYIPIIAHIDRYSLYKKEDYNVLAELPDVVFQINISSLSTFRGRHLAHKLIRQGNRVLFSSDCHNITSRPPNFDILTLDTSRTLRESDRELFLEAHFNATKFITEPKSKEELGLFF